jgi:peptide deformylase
VLSLISCTDKAVVTLLYENSIQFINTTNNTKDNKIEIGEGCLSVTAVKDKIYIGGVHQVIILNIDGTRIREIATRQQKI